MSEQAGAGSAWKLILLALLVVALAGLLAKRGVGPSTMIFLGAAVISAIVLLCVPVHWLPALAAAALALFPTGVLPSTGIFAIVPPISLIMVVWVLRRILFAQGPPGTAASMTPAPVLRNAVGRYLIWVCAALFVAWCCWRIMVSPAKSSSIGWMIAFTIGALLPLLVLDARAESRVLRRTLLVVGACAGGYAIIEMLLGGSPIYEPLYRILGEERAGQQWSVYRAQVAFAHPLFAGSFLVIPAALGIGSWLAGGRHRDGVLGLVAALGVVATVSRGSILALAGAVIFALLVALFLPGQRHAKRILFLGGLAVLAAFALARFPPLQARTNSVESGLSSDARDAGAYIALRAAEASGWLGSGPGTSGIAGRQFSMVVIENSLLQLLISVGIPGLLLFVLTLAIACFLALTARDIGAAAALVGYTIALAGFNSLDALRLLHVVIGLLLLLCLNPSNPASDAPPTGDSATRSQRSRRRSPAVGRRALAEVR